MWVPIIPIWQVILFQYDNTKTVTYDEQLAQYI